MTDAPERFSDTRRNKLINQTVSDLEKIINNHVRVTWPEVMQ